MAAPERRRDSAFAVIVRDAHVLLVRPKSGRRWQLPGGGLKRSETPHEGLRREVEEETGLVVRVHALAGTYLRSDGSSALVFLARVSDDAEPTGPRNEIRQQRWVRRREALELLPPRARERLADALRRQRVGA